MRNRIKRLDYIAANQLLANPNNPRRHPGKQREALRGSLETLGYYDAVIMNERTGYLIDGHARVEEQLTLNETALIPVLVVDMTEAEENQALLTHDYITQMAIYDQDTLNDLLQQTEAYDDRIADLLQDMGSMVSVPEPKSITEDEPDQCPTCGQAIRG